MKVETRTFTVYTVTKEEKKWLEKAGIWDVLLDRLRINEKVEVNEYS